MRHRPRKGSPKGESMIFVLDKHKKPLMPCTEKRARLLLTRGCAIMHKMMPFTIRLKDRIIENSQLQPLRLKLDPGSKATGFAILQEVKSEAIILGEIHHKPGIKSKLETRRALRRGRRHRKTRYRKPRFNNRRKHKGWLPPSLSARVDQTMNAINKLINLLPITAISTEHIKFDTQLMQKPEITGVEYQQGKLYGYEVREYLLEKWGRKCAYCNKTGLPLEIEHIIPKSRKGTDRVSNLTLACHDCNKTKGTMTAEEFGHPEIQAKAKKPLRDTSIMNATRWALYNRLKGIGVPVECGTGARTKMQRIALDLPKTHYFDALCVGASTPTKILINIKYALIWSAKGRGTRKMCNVNHYGFPISHRTRKKTHFGFQTGDIVTVTITKGKYKGYWTGRVLVRANGNFDIKTLTVQRISVSYKNFVLLQRNSGWQYEKKVI